MKFRPFPRPSAAMVVALTALVVAASGTAIAAGGLSSGDRLIAKGTLSGNRLRGHTLTGRQINLKKLGSVPLARLAKFADVATTARTANHATTASTAISAIRATVAGTATSATTAQLARTLPPLVWTPITLTGGWTNYPSPGFGDPAGYTQDALGFVHLRGALEGSSHSSEIIGQLPAGLRPPHGVVVPLANTNGSTGPQVVNLRVDTGGQMIIVPGSGANQNFISLAGVEFSVR